MNKVNKKPASFRVGASRAKKEQIVAKLKDKVGKANGLVFTNYQGLTHKQIENLKRKLNTASAELVVTKNTLLKRAFLHPDPSAEGSILNSELRDPTATLFIYGDLSEPLKQLAQSIKQFNLPSVKFGILDKKTITKEQVIKLFTLPSRDILLMQVFGQMKAPIFGLHRVLSWNMQKLVVTLKAIESKRS
ncbi:MAG: 50S ribosomal protein L10 [Patescibacteria group bacterium]